MSLLVSLLLLASPARAVDREATLSEMGARGVISATQTSWSQDEWALLWKLKKAEGEGAIDLLIKKLRRIRPFIVVLKRPDGTQKFLLTAAGYERYRFYKSQDAIRAFESRGIALKSVFHLTDLSGKFFFDSSGGLTDEGEEAYDVILRNGAPEWKYDYEPVPEKKLPKDKRGDPPEIKAMKQAGMEELDDAETAWLLKTTGCSQRGLESESTFQSVTDSFRNRPRYFMSPKDPVFGMVARYRGGETGAQTIGGTAFFGQGRGGLCP